MRSRISTLRNNLESPSRTREGFYILNQLVFLISLIGIMIAFGTSSKSDLEPRWRRSRRHHQKQHSFDIKIEILEFEGTFDPDEFLDWLHTVEKVFDHQDIQEDKKV